MRPNTDPLGLLRGVIGPIEVRQVDTPLPADDQWTCFYFPGPDESGWSWNIEHVARSLWKTIKIARRVPLP